MSRPPLPPFTQESAIEKVRLAEDGMEQPRSCQGGACIHARYTLAQPRRVREKPRGGGGFPEPQVEQGTRLSPHQRTLGLHRNRIAVRYAYEYRDDSGQWFRAYGNENWEFAEDGLMRNVMPASTNTRLPKQTASFVGPSAADQMTILA